MSGSFFCSFDANELNAREALISVADRLKTFGFPENRLYEIQIALSEAVNNIVEHAYANNPFGKVEITCSLEDQNLLIEIQDTGLPLPNLELPKGKLSPLSSNLESLPEGGFGWFLIKELTTNVHYRRVDETNNLQLIFSII